MEEGTNESVMGKTKKRENHLKVKLFSTRNTACNALSKSTIWRRTQKFKKGKAYEELKRKDRDRKKIAK